MKEPFLVLDVDQFLVSSRFDENDHGALGAACGNSHDCLLQLFELSAAIGGDDDISDPSTTARAR